MKISVRGLFVVVAMVATALSALTRPTPAIEFLTVSTTCAAIVFGVLMNFIGAKWTSKRIRLNFLTFSLLAAAYLGFAYIPDSSGHSPRRIGPEFTTSLLGWYYKQSGYEIVSKSPGDLASDSGLFCVQDRQEYLDDDIAPFSESDRHDILAPSDVREYHASELDVNVSNLAGYGIYINQQKRFARFMKIGHCIWAILFGSIGAACQSCKGKWKKAC